MEETTGYELEHLTGVYFTIGNNREGRHRADLITNIRQAMYSEQKHLTILLKDGPHTDTHTQKEMDPVGLYSAPQPRRERRAGDQGLVGTWLPRAVMPATARVGPVVRGSLDGEQPRLQTRR